MLNKNNYPEMKAKTKAIQLALLLLIASAPSNAQTKKPNIVLILVDDMGYSDIGAYGSEINTPNLDQLAKEGLRLKEFYNNSICAPTRASLLTGQYQHKAGVGYFDVNLGLPAYQGYLNKQSLTLAEVLKQAGYTTLHSGKWHVGNDSLSWPLQRGFDKSFALIGGASNYFDSESWQKGNPKSTVIIDNNKRWKKEAGSYYFTDEISDHATEYIEAQTKSEKPFFLYLAYTAPHWPLQALPEDIAKYKGKYSIGWDSLRNLRFQQLVKLGLVNKDVVTEKDPDVPEWNSLTYNEKILWAEKMEVFAAMVDRMDQGVGKVLAALKKAGKADNTLIVFISDNGAPAEDVAHRKGFSTGRNTGPVGTSGSFESQGKGWSSASNTPFRSYKAFAYEGGISSPFIAWYPAKIKANSLAKGTAHLIDLAPTFYELAGATYPATYKGTKINRLAGKSLVPLLQGQVNEVKRDEPLFWERAGNRAVRSGKWKLVSIYPSYAWELYNLQTDRVENQNVAAKYPEVVNELSKYYFEWADKNDVVDYEKIKPKNSFEDQLIKKPVIVKQ